MTINTPDYIVVTRPEPFASQLAEKIQHEGGRPFLFPVMTIAQVQEGEVLKSYLAKLSTFDLAVFTSPTAVRQTFSFFSASLQWPQQVSIAAIGPGTARALSELDLEVAWVPPADYRTEGLLALPRFKHVRSQKIIIFRGEGGRTLLAQALEARGAQIFHAIVYRRTLPTQEAQKQTLAWKGMRIDAIVITSQEALSNLLILVGETQQDWLKQQRLLVTSPRIKEAALRLGFASLYVAHDASNEAIVDALKRGEWRGTKTLT